MEADVLMTSSDGKRPHPWHDNRPFNPKEKKARSTVLNPCLIDFTEFTMSADYIHSAELVNTRYPRQTVGSVFQGDRGGGDAAIQAAKCLTQPMQTACNELAMGTNYRGIRENSKGDCVRLNSGEFSYDRASCHAGWRPTPSGLNQT